jgi:type I restriction enzyme S subunit
MTELKSLPRYEKYRDSGLEWLPEIPKHWGLEKGKWLYNKEDRKVRTEDEVVTCFRDGEVTLRSNRRTEGFTNAIQEHGYQGIRKGDLVIHAMDAFAGAIGVSDSDGKSSPVYSACTPRIPNMINSKFYAYYMRDLALSGFLVSLAKGIRERSTDFRFKDFGELRLPLPSFSEQAAIVNYLDQKTAQVDQAIAIKEKQIALLKERKQILIQNAVTRGLNPDVPMRDSGVEWIGKIPGHWGLIKFKYSMSIKARLGWKGLKADEYVDHSNYGFLSTPNIKTKDINYQEAYFITKERYDESPEIMLQSGDVLLVKDGSTLGISNMVRDMPFKCTVNSSIAVLRIFDIDITSPEYFELFLKSETMQRLISTMKDGMGVPHLFQADIKNFSHPVPPINEQTKIVEYIKIKSVNYDKAIDMQKQQIEKLKEYKATLINSAVTGKIKVPGVDKQQVA